MITTKKRNNFALTLILSMESVVCGASLLEQTKNSDEKIPKESKANDDEKKKF